MRAMKDVEVGNYYFNIGNYKAALSRYREALQYKPRDAVATFKLAQTLEKSKEFEEARIRYQEYLAILKDGPKCGRGEEGAGAIEEAAGLDNGRRYVVVCSKVRDAESITG